MVHADHVRPVRQGSDVERGAHRACDLPIREILNRMRHDGCGGRAGKVELLIGIEGASSRPVRRITLTQCVMALTVATSEKSPGHKVRG